MSWYLIIRRKRKRSITYAPMIDRDVKRLRHLNRLYHGTEKRPRGSKPPAKKPLRTKSRFAECIDEISGTMKLLRDTLAATSPQMPQPTDPHASLWQRLEAIPLTPDQRVLIGEHLSTKENKGKRGWLCNASDDTLHAWVFKYLCEKEGFNM